MVSMSLTNGSCRKGTRASSRIVTMVAWLTCWYMSISDQRTGTGVVKRSATCSRSCRSRHATDLAGRHRQRRQVELAVSVDLVEGALRPIDAGTVGQLPLLDLLLTGLVRLADGQHIEAQRPQRTIDVVADRQARQRMPPIIALQLRDRGEQAVDAEMVHQREVGVGHLGCITVGDIGDVDDVEQAVAVQAG